jgi:hypothetical protein
MIEEEIDDHQGFRHPLKKDTMVDFTIIDAYTTTLIIENATIDGAQGTQGRSRPRQL